MGTLPTPKPEQEDQKDDSKEQPPEQPSDDKATGGRITKHETSKTTRDVGNVTAESTLYLEYNIDKKHAALKGKASVPFQLQIHYTALDGAKMMRVIHSQQLITRDRKKVQEDVNIDVMTS